MIDVVLFFKVFFLLESKYRFLIIIVFFFVLIFVGLMLIFNIWVVFEFMGVIMGFFLGFIFLVFVVIRLNIKRGKYVYENLLFVWMMVVMVVIVSFIGIGM